MAELSIEKLSKTFPSPPITAVDHFSIDVRDRELLVLLGPSGCGKTTLLRLIAGLEQPNSGAILLDGKNLNPLPPQSRAVGMAFQYPALLPQLTVEQNIALGPKLRGVPAPVANARVRELAQLLDVNDLLARAPATLSGGQQQRVSLARALANQPALLLLDEPLANLDPISRADLRDAIRSVQQKLGVTTLYVTHDQAEAAAVADRIAIMKAGRLEQAGTAPELYNDPANLFVAEFFAPERPNVLNGELKDGRFFVGDSHLQFETRVRRSGKAICVIRPHSIQAGGDFSATVKDVRQTGWNTSATLEIFGINLRADLHHFSELKSGESFRCTIKPESLLLFDPVTGTRLRAELDQ